jgi:hypothetical protein
MEPVSRRFTPFQAFTQDSKATDVPALLALLLISSALFGISSFTHEPCATLMHHARVSRRHPRVNPAINFPIVDTLAASITASMYRVRPGHR